ncbi:MAG: hypothetical protein DI570_30770, partial [Phenylobacterium zucineum]
AGRTTKYVYDAADRLTTTIYPDDTPGTDADNPFTLSVYDDGVLVSTSDERGNTTHYGYDDAGRQTSVTNALSQTTTTVYDASGRRTKVIDALLRETQFVYADGDDLPGLDPVDDGQPADARELRRRGPQGQRDRPDGADHALCLRQGRPPGRGVPAQPDDGGEPGAEPDRQPADVARQRRAGDALCLRPARQQGQPDRRAEPRHALALR